MIERPIWYSSARLSMALALLPRSGSVECTGLGASTGEELDVPARSCARAPADRASTAARSTVNWSLGRLIPPSHHSPGRPSALIFRGAVLEDFGGLIGEPGAFAALQGDVRTVRPAAKPADHIGEAGGGLGEIGRVDLRDIAQADHLGARAGPRQQCLHLLGREVLRLVDDDEAVHEGATAHEIQRAD